MRLLNQVKQLWERPTVRGLFIGWIIFGALFAAWLYLQPGTDLSGLGLGNYMDGTPIH